MNRYKVFAFGITRQLLGGREVTIDVQGSTVGDLRKTLGARFPALLDLNSLFIAVNNAYTDDDQVLLSTDEIALIPPVSGG